MNFGISKRIAFFKREPNKSVPIRPGPLLIRRSCGNCMSQEENSSLLSEPTDPYKSFDNFLVRKSVWLSNYQSVQYHIGQFDALKQIMKSNPGQPFIFVVGVTRSSDIRFLNWILEHMKLPKLKSINSNLNSASKDNIALLLNHKSCPVNYSYFQNNENNYLSPKELEKHISNLIEVKGNDLKPFIVPVIITKDHDSATTLGLGSVCIQVLEPFSIHNYNMNSFQESLSTHMTLHIYHDINKFGVMLPSHVVAFLILFLNRTDGVSYEDLIDYMNWFKKCSLDFEMYFGFTGNIEHAVEFGLFVLRDYILEKKDKIFYIKDEEKLLDYAQLFVPTVAYYGIISEAILMEHNRSNSNNVLTCFTPNVSIRVNREYTFEIAEDLSNILEKNITCRKPCEKADIKIEDTFTNMCTFKHYFKLEEPLLNVSQGTRLWVGDFEFDDDQYDRKNNPHCQTWINVTQRPYRLDRLNLFVNAVSLYINQ